MDFASDLTFCVYCHLMAKKHLRNLHKPASTINQLRHCHEYNMERITLRLDYKPNIALGFTSCYASFLTVPLCYFFNQAHAGCRMTCVCIVS